MSTSPRRSDSVLAPEQYAADLHRPVMRPVMLVVVVGFFVGAASLWRGPAMGDHEVIVAQIAKQSIETGDWIVPHYLDTPFLVKPPMAPWLVGGTTALANTLSGYSTPAGAADMAFSTAMARLPSVLAVIVTSLVIWRLASSMFGRATGLIAAFVYVSSLGAMLFAFNATAESLLTLFCTWAFAEFWWAQQSDTPRQRRLHLALFYLAFGLAMLAKGPMPLMWVGPAIAVYWWTHRPLALLASNGIRSSGAAAKLAITDFLPQLKQALSRLGLWWGIPIFLTMFLPWMMIVDAKVPYAWELWHYEYLDRLRGDYPGCKVGRYYYYIPLLLGLMTPWLLSLPEAMAAPFLRRYRDEARPLLFVWCWVIVGTIIVSLMSFKKPYYIVPAIPGCALLLAPVLREFFFRIRNLNLRMMRTALAAILCIWAIGWVILWFVARDMYPEIWHGSMAVVLPWIAVGITLAVAASGILYLKNRRRASFVGLGITSLVSFGVAWCTIGPAVDNLDDPLTLVSQLNHAGIPADAEVYWASNRPDGRVSFYGNRTIRQIVDPYKLVAEHEEVHDDDDLRMFVGSKICTMLKTDHRVFVVFQRGQLGLLKMFCNPPIHEVCQVDRGEIGPDEDDWVVVSNVSVKTAELSDSPDSSLETGLP